MNSERFYILTPQATDKLAANSEGQLFPVYLDASGLEMKWSGKMQVPAIGDRIYLRINSLGWAKVEGYAESHGYLGLLALPENPPDWFRRQTKEHSAESVKAIKLGPAKATIERLRVWPDWINRGVACVFGAEISLDATAPKVSAGSVQTSQSA